MKQKLHDFLICMCFVEQRCVELRNVACAGNYVTGHTVKETLTEEQVAQLELIMAKLNLNIIEMNEDLARLVSAVHNPL